MKDRYKSKIAIGILFGVVAGTIDIIPMIAQGLSWDANISAFIMWVIIGFFIALTEIRLNSILKGIVVGFLVLMPTVFIIGWDNPKTLIPIFIMTLILGGFLGFFIDKRIQKL